MIEAQAARVLVIGDAAVAGRVREAVPGWEVAGSAAGRGGIPPVRSPGRAWDVVVVEVPATDEAIAVPLRVRTDAPGTPLLPVVHSSEVSHLLRELGCLPAIDVTAPPQRLAGALGSALGWRPPPMRSDPLMTYLQRLTTVPWPAPRALRVAVLASSDLLRIGLRELVVAAGGAVSLETTFPEVLRNHVVAGDQPRMLVADSAASGAALELAHRARLPVLVAALTITAGYRALERAQGVLVEPIKVHALAAALRAVADGDRYLDPRLERPFDGSPLTKTERRIAGMILQEKRPDAMVRELNLRPVTLRWHVSNIYSKLGVDSLEGIRAWVDR
jgi:DNA-binding NarL/FixJ family response regulator